MGKKLGFLIIRQIMDDVRRPSFVDDSAISWIPHTYTCPLGNRVLQKSFILFLVSKNRNIVLEIEKKILYTFFRAEMNIS